MIDVKASLRQCIVVLLAVFFAGWLCRHQISNMLVERGDVAAISHPAHAVVLYHRALALDGENTVAADRLIFRGLMSHDAKGLRDAVELGRVELKRSPGDTASQMDMALCEQVLRRFNDAERDFEAVGVKTRDARALLFAADDEAKLRNVRRQMQILRLARHLDPNFIPVRVAMLKVLAK
jgi:hypothetical protein